MEAFTERILRLTKTNERYEDFTVLDTPVPFKELFKDRDFDYIQIHDTEPCPDGDIIGFCGVCSWKDNVLKPLDGDTYTDSMTVCGYSYFTNSEEGVSCGLEILVREW